MTVRLYSYWRSSAAYRVRIALNLKGIEHEIESVSLKPGEAEHRKPPYRDRNPQMLVPYLEDGDTGIAQSQAILEYLEEAYPDPPLLPSGAQQRAAVRSFCNLICCDIHPLNNLRVMLYLRKEFGADDEAIGRWYAHWVHEGFGAAEIIAGASDSPFLFGTEPTLADVCLVPQLYNARRFDVPVEAFPRLVAIDARCSELAAFADARPERQPDAD